MGRKRYQPEQIICKQRAPEVLLANAGFGIMPSFYTRINHFSEYNTQSYLC